MALPLYSTRKTHVPYHECLRHFAPRLLDTNTHHISRPLYSLAPPIEIAPTLLIARAVHRLFLKDNVPNLFKYPPNHEIVQMRIHRPVPHPHVIAPRPLANPIASHDKLRTAHAADAVRDLGLGASKQSLVNLDHVCSRVIIPDVCFRWILWENGKGTTWLQ